MIENVGSTNEKPYTDPYGRCTQFYVALTNNVKIWLYQPGSVMLDSGVVPGELEVFHGGS